MKRLLLFCLFGAALSINGYSQASDLFISEYAEGSSFNKYIEIYNGTGDSVNLADYEIWRISNGGSWPEATQALTGWIQDGEAIVFANGSADTAILNIPGTVVASILSHNGDDAVGLAKDTGSSSFVLIDAVGENGPDPGSGWDVAGVNDATANHTLVRKINVCDPDTNWENSAGTADSNSQWFVFSSNTWDSAGMHTMNCSWTPPPPTTSVTPEYPIADINNVDANGVADSSGVTCWTRGVVVGIDLDGNDGYSFTIMDVDGTTEGINVFSFVDVDNYVVVEGDSIRVLGEIGQYNGLTQIVPDSIALLNQNNQLPDTATVTTLTEADESELLKIENVLITGLSGSNYTIVNATDTLIMRVDSDTDVEDSLSLAIGDSLCYVVGIGGQFDNSSPYTSGYQIFPRYYTDLDTSCGASTTPPPPAPTVNEYPIPDINNDDVNGEPDSIGVVCWTRGVVLGIDLDGNNGLSFTLWDDEGINIFNFNDVSNYVVTEGDSIRVRGEIDFYNGLTELFVDSIEVLSSGNTIPTETLVSVPSAATESNPIVIEDLRYVVGSNTWPEPGFFSTNVLLHNCAGDTITMRMDSDTDIDENWVLDSNAIFTVHGIGGQFDNSFPYTDGYQIFPMEIGDIDTMSAPAAPSGLVINELMADNVSTVEDENGDYDDWIELYNASANSVDLAGLYITNDAADPMKYQIPMSSNESIASGGYALIWADNESNEGDLHTNFELDASGGLVWIGAMEGCGIVGLDSAVYTALAADESYGRVEDGSSEWTVFGTATPGAMNEILSVSERSTNVFKAWPNPNNGDRLFFNQAATVQVYNLTGQQVISAERALSLDLSELESGLYLIEAEDGSTMRLIIQ